MPAAELSLTTGMPKQPRTRSFVYLLSLTAALGGMVFGERSAEMKIARLALARTILQALTRTS